MIENNKELYQCLESYKYIATIGTCKNAGKTTVLNYLLDNFRESYVLGITSIGYDGEEKDAVTKLSKPRIQAYSGLLIATSEACLEATSIKYRLVEETAYKTVLGKILIVEALNSGIIDVAGPSMASQLDCVVKKMLNHGANKVIADGAAGRVSYAAYADCSVLSVGAAKFNDLDKIVTDGAYRVKLLSLKQTDQYTLEDLPKDVIVYEKQIEVPGKKSYATDTHYLFRGIVADQDIEKILKSNKYGHKTLIVKDASAVFLSQKTYMKLRQRNGHLEVIQPIYLKAVTINPMTPYGEWVDEKAFKEKMQERLKQPVYNVKEGE